MQLPPMRSQAAVVEDYVSVPGISPYTFKDDAKFRISQVLLEEAEQYGPPWKFFNLPLICNALEHPSKILEGLKRANYDDGFCYSLLSPHQWINETTRANAPPLKVWVVYVHPSEGNLLVLDWDWRIAGLKEPDLPHNWRKDFTRVIWPTN
jgi:hypothetical protein